MRAYDEYLADVAAYRQDHPEQRAGQAHYNVLRRRDPSLTERLVGTSSDPFDIDDRLPQFLAIVRARLEASDAG